MTTQELATQILKIINEYKQKPVKDLMTAQYLAQMKVIEQIENLCQKSIRTPEQGKKHDGKLGDGLSIHINEESNDVILRDDIQGFFTLAPAEVLSLRDWIQQNEETLIQLAKDEEEKA